MDKKKLIKGVGFVAILFILYLGNIKLQTYLGNKALKSTGLHSLTFEEALIQSSNTNKPILVELSAIWCPTCRKLDKTALADKEVTALINERFIFSRLEYESEEAQTFMERYKVSDFPTLLIFKPKRSNPEPFSLTFEPDVFLNQLNKVIKN